MRLTGSVFVLSVMSNSSTSEKVEKDSLYPLRQMVKTRLQLKEELERRSTAMSNQSAFNQATSSLRKFDGKNFSVWRCQLEAYLTVRDCINPLYNSRPLSTPNDKDKEVTLKLQESWDNQNKMARAIIFLALCDEQAILVCHLETAKLIWERLLEANEQRSQSSRVVLMRQFCDSTMREGERIMDYVSRVQRVFIQLRESGTAVTEETLVGRIVGGLTSSYHVFITNWGNNPNLKQTMAELIPRLTAEEILMKKFKKADTVAMVAERSTGQRSNRGNSKKTSENKSRKPTEDAKKRFKCYKCGQKGHFRSECKSGNKSSNTKPDQPEEAVVAEGIVAEANAAVHEGEWILDTGATEHMTYDASNFVSFERFDSPGPVKFGGTMREECLGRGDIPLIAKVDGGYKHLLLRGVLYVPNMRRKLISIGKTISLGHTGEIQKSRIIIKNDSDEIILVGLKQDNLYRALVRESTDRDKAEVAVAEEEATRDSDLTLWHERLAHVNRATIVRMKKHSSVTGLESSNFNVDPKASDRKVINCESCCQAKHARQPIPLSTRARAEEVGQALHVDICGPIGTATLSGAKYITVFKDESSNFRFAYFIKSKEEAHGCLRKCIAQVRADTGKSVLSLVSDLGSEFTSNRSQVFLNEQGIIHKTSAPFTPQQNGFVERENRTIMEAVRSMLYHRKLPEQLWGEAANTAVYTLNRVLNSRNGNKTPFELYHKNKPRVSHMRVFGSVAFMKAQEKKRSGYQKKLEPRSNKMIFVGYDRDYTYRLYDPESRKIFITREVIFDEGKMPELNGSADYSCIEEVTVPDDCNDEAIESDDESIVDESNYAQSMVTIDGEPGSYKAAIHCPDRDKWVKAMREEYDSLIKNNTWVVEDLPAGKRPITNKWVFKIKRDTSGAVVRYKARLVARGYSQRKGIDYEDTFSPVARMDSVRIILSIIAEKDLEMVHFDVKTAFLHGELSEEIWMREPEGFEIGGNKACRLKKSLYGLKQASRSWNHCLVKTLKEFDLQPLLSDSCVFTKKSKNDLLVVAVYVDDGLASSNNEKLLEELVTFLKRKFEITVDQVKCFVGLEISRNRLMRKLSISQSAYIKRVIERFELGSSNPCEVPMRPSERFVKSGIADGGDSKAVNVPYEAIIGSLIYVMHGTRPDIAYAVAILSRFNQCPKLAHWNAAKAVVKYRVAQN